MGFKIVGFVFRVRGLGFKGLRFMVYGRGFRV
jgi:hypothetical protein